MSSIRKVSIAEKLASFDEAWSPRIVGELNGQHVKLAKLRDSFLWHHHEHEDELFLVIRGRLRIELRDGEVTLAAGEFVIIPHGVEHRPIAEPQAEVLLFEPASTLNTGNVSCELTVENPPRI